MRNKPKDIVGSGSDVAGEINRVNQNTQDKIQKQINDRNSDLKENNTPKNLRSIIFLLVIIMVNIIR